jgi:DNA-binding transcriptional MerR regulator
MAERDHHSIGEVLAMVQQDFPDVTISKIRFLESQGLLDPERTNSGYRKFYDRDVERLRWILHQQRDHYLPLKVIKDRILNGFADGNDPSEEDADQADSEVDAVPADAQPETTDARTPAQDRPPKREPTPEPKRVAETPAKSAATATATPSAPVERDPLDEGLTSVSMTAAELAGATGLTPDQVADLQSYGLIESRIIGAADLYEGEALKVAKLAAAFIERGIEVRHLKMYRLAAEREAGFYEQVVSPLASHRDPATRSRARTEVRDLVRLGADLRSALLRRALRDQLGGP